MMSVSRSAMPRYLGFSMPFITTSRDACIPRLRSGFAKSVVSCRGLDLLKGQRRERRLAFGCLGGGGGSGYLGSLDILDSGAMYSRGLGGADGVGIVWVVVRRYNKDRLSWELRLSDGFGGALRCDFCRGVHSTCSHSCQRVPKPPHADITLTAQYTIPSLEVSTARWSFSYSETAYENGVLSSLLRLPLRPIHSSFLTFVAVCLRFSILPNVTRETTAQSLQVSQEKATCPPGDHLAAT